MLENLINDLLDLAKLENNSFNISNSYFDLSQVIHNTFQMLSFKATQHKIHLWADIDDISHLSLIH
jgi:signal transduction histidine kinase